MKSMNLNLTEKREKSTRKIKPNSAQLHDTKELRNGRKTGSKNESKCKQDEDEVREFFEAVWSVFGRK